MSDVQPLPSPCGGPRLAELRRFDTGELTGDDRDRIRHHTEACPRCQATLRDFAADRLALQTSVPFAALERRVASRPTALTRLWRRITLVSFGGALAAAGVILLMHPTTATDGAPAPSVTRTKGGVALDYMLKRGTQVTEGRDGENLKAGDAIEFRYSSGGLPYVLIVGVDADGRVFPYVVAGDRSAPAGRGTTIAPNSVVLDADPRPERVFAVFSREPVAVDEIKPAARDGLTEKGGIVGLTALPGFPDQASLLLNKAAR
jgi:hypothetical protein